MLSFLLQRYKENHYAVFLSCRIITIYTCNRLHLDIKRLTHTIYQIGAFFTDFTYSTQGVTKVYPRCSQGVPKVLPRCTQGVAKVKRLTDLG